MTPTEERLAITIDAILGFYSTGDAERDRRSAAVIAKALLDELDIDRIERDAYERGFDAGRKDVLDDPPINIGPSYNEIATFEYERGQKSIVEVVERWYDNYCNNVPQADLMRVLETVMEGHR